MGHPQNERAPLHPRHHHTATIKLVGPFYFHYPPKTCVEVVLGKNDDLILCKHEPVQSLTPLELLFRIKLWGNFIKLLFINLISVQTIF